jgi:hypothetical protein
MTKPPTRKLGGFFVINQSIYIRKQPLTLIEYAQSAIFLVANIG